MLEGVLLLGHGSRRPEANQEILQIAELVQARGGDAVYQTGFLQFGTPTLSGAVAKLARAGVRKITVVPLLLVVGTHIQDDLPRLIQEQKRLYPDITFFWRPTWGRTHGLLKLYLSE